MKKVFNLLLLVLCFSSIHAAVSTKNFSVADFNNEPEVRAVTVEKDMAQMTLDKFLELTPKKYQELTGKKLGLKKTLQLKAAQKIIKKRTNKAGDMPKGAYIVLAIFNLCWIAMGVMDDWEGNNWWVNLLLSICYLPALIHALVKMDDYY